jgi:hypothetical protein
VVGCDGEVVGLIGEEVAIDLVDGHEDKKCMSCGVLERHLPWGHQRGLALVLAQLDWEEWVGWIGHLGNFGPCAPSQILWR